MPRIYPINVDRPIEFVTNDGRQAIPSGGVVIDFDRSAAYTDRVYVRIPQGVEYCSRASGHTTGACFWYWIRHGKLGGGENNTAYHRIRNVPGTRARKRPTNVAKPSKPTAQSYDRGAVPRWNAHGGGCCGVSHIHLFTGRPSDMPRYGSPRGHTKEGQFKAALTSIRASRHSGLIEAILLPEQVRNWETVLLEAGFKNVKQFYNSNTGNRLNVYHLAYGRMNKETAAVPKAKVASPFK